MACSIKCCVNNSVGKCVALGATEAIEPLESSLCLFAFHQRSGDRCSSCGCTQVRPQRAKAS